MYSLNDWTCENLVMNSIHHPAHHVLSLDRSVSCKCISMYCTLSFLIDKCLAVSTVITSSFHVCVFLSADIQLSYKVTSSEFAERKIFFFTITFRIIQI